MSDYNLPVNIGNPEEITINQLADELCEMVGIDIERINKPLPAGDPLKRKPDITKAFELLDWYPKITRQEGMSKTLDYFSQDVEAMKGAAQPKSFEAFIRR